MPTNREIQFVLKMKNIASRKIKEAGGDLRRMGKRANEAGRNLKKTGEHSRVSAKRVAELRKELGRLNRKQSGDRDLLAWIAKVQAGLGRIPRAAKRAGAALGLVFGAYAAGAIGADFIQVFSNFDAQMSAVEAVTGAVGKRLEELRKTAKALGRTTIFTGTQAASGLEFLARAGFSAKEATEALPATLDLAAAASIDLGRSADIASNIMQTFGMEAANTRKAVDTLAIVNSNANTNVLQLSEAMKYAGPIAAGFGVSMDETASAIGALGNSGLQGSLAGTGVRMALIDAKMLALGDHSKTAQQAFDALNIDPDKFDPEKVGLRDMIDALRQSGAGMDQLVKMFGARAAPTVLTLMKNFEDFNDLLEKNATLNGEAARQAKARQDNLMGDAKAFRSAIEGLYIRIGEFLNGAMRGVTQFATAVVQVIQGAEVTFKKFEAAATALGETLKFIFRFGTVLAGMAALNLAFTATTTVLRGGLIPAVRLLGKALYALPVFGQLALVLAGLWTAFDKLKTVTFEWRGTTLQLGQVFNTVFGDIGRLVSSAVSTVQGALAAMTTTVSTAAGKIEKAWMGSMVGWIGDAMTAIKEFYNEAIGSATSFVQSVAVVVKAIKTVFEQTFNVVAELAKHFWKRLATGGQIWVNNIRIITTEVKGVWQAALLWMAQKWSDFIGGIEMGEWANWVPGLDKAKAALDGVQEGAKGMVESMQGGVEGTTKALADLRAENTTLRAMRDETTMVEGAWKNLQKTVSDVSAEVSGIYKNNLGRDFIGEAFGVAESYAINATNRTKDRVDRRNNTARMNERYGDGNGGFTDPTMTLSYDQVRAGMDLPKSGSGDEGGSKGSKGSGSDVKTRAERMKEFAEKVRDGVQALKTEIKTTRAAQRLMREYGMTKENATKVAEITTEARELGVSEKRVDKLRQAWTKLLQTRDAVAMQGKGVMDQFKIGMRDFIKNVQDGTQVAGNVVQQIGGTTGMFLDKMLEDGKSFMGALKSTAAETLKNIGKMILEHAMKVMIFKNLLGGLSGGPTGSGGGGNFFTNIGKAMGFAKGAAFDAQQGVKRFKDGGSFTNGVYDKPTRFSYGGGKQGEMGEAGPEAVMPLKRGRDGKLGIVANGVSGSGGNSLTINTTINLGSGSDGPAKAMGDKKQSREFGKVIQNEVNAAVSRRIAKEMRPGGMLTKGKG